MTYPFDTIHNKLKLFGNSIIKKMDNFIVYQKDKDSYGAVLNIDGNAVFKDDIDFNSFVSNDYFLILKTDGSLWSEMLALYTFKSDKNLLDDIPECKSANDILLYTDGDLRLYTTEIEDKQRVLFGRTRDNKYGLLFNSEGKRLIISNIKFGNRTDIWCLAGHFVFKGFKGDDYLVLNHWYEDLRKNCIFQVDHNLQISKVNKNHLSYGDTLIYREI